jgi:hypothetical protein
MAPTRALAALAALALAAAAAAPAAAQPRRAALDDATFERVTQAATGQTTGVWVVLFCAAGAPACAALRLRWAALAAEFLESDLPSFLATVDATAAPRTAARFLGAGSERLPLPAVVMFRGGRMYRFAGAGAAPEAVARLEAWIGGEWRAEAGEAVPPPHGPLDAARLAARLAGASEGAARAVARLAELGRDPVVGRAAGAAALVVIATVAAARARAGKAKAAAFAQRKRA